MAQPGASQPAAGDGAARTEYREGVAAQQRGDIEAAAVAFRKALVLDPEYFNALQMLGILEAQRGRLDAAEPLLARARALRPDDPSVYNNHANVLCALRRYDEARAGFERAIALNPAYSDAHSNLGKALYDQGRALEALASFDRALALRPETIEVIFQRGLVLVKLNRAAEAMTAFDRVLALRPGHADAHFNRGSLLRNLGRLDEALVGFERAIAAHPDSAEAHCNRANILHMMSQCADALTAVNRALAIRADFALAHSLRAGILADLNQLTEALTSVESAIALQPDMAEAHNNRGVVLRRLDRPAEALSGFDRALALRPDYAAAHANRGIALLDLERIDEALASLDRALAIDPRRADSWNIRGNILQALNRHTEAQAHYVRSRELRPGYGEAEWNESVCRLLQGDFEQGWPLYESRWRNGQRLGEVKHGAPLWDGRFVEGRLLVWGEQGIGDQIHHLGMADTLEGHASEVVIAVATRLLPLVARSFPGMKVADLRQAPHLRCVAQTPAGSLGRYLRKSWAEFPVQRTAYLKADPERVAACAHMVAGEGRLVCGLSWHSAAPKVGPSKSMTLRALAPLLGIKDVHFVDLQYGETAAEREAAKQELGANIQHVDAVHNREDLDGLAALIAACDVVVTISNTTAHLAGALGKPTLLMLPSGIARHWYWHEAREDSPWYPSLRLFRQQQPGQWDDVIAGVASAVRTMAKKPSGKAGKR